MSNDTVREIDPNAPTSQPSPAPAWAAPLVGVLAAAVGVGIGQLLAAIAGTALPLDAVGSEFIDHTPKWLKVWAVDTFGTADKTALRTGVVITIVLLAACAGWASRRRPMLGAALIAIAAIGGAVICARRPGQSASAAVAPLVGGAAAVWVLMRLSAFVRNAIPAQRPGRSKVPLGWDRRRFLVWTGGAASVAAIGVASARRLESQRIADLTADSSAPLPSVQQPTVISETGPAGATLSPDTPFITANDGFYRIDTALSFPDLNINDWSVKIGGMVDNPIELSYQDLLARPQVERTITIACVSNDVGGDLIGTAVWQGVLLADILKEAGVQPGAEQVFSVSADGWTCGFPVEAAFDGRDSMIAIGMNGESLPVMHGFPARLIIPGLYGYVSATKWLSEIKVTTWAQDEGYWVPRGWAREAPIKTQSRIDVPRRGQSAVAGDVVIAGIAWAQQRGVERVEVGIDGTWFEATLATDVSNDAWRQWKYVWPATAGEYVVQVRATDKNGETQTEQVSRPDPDGATGYHTRKISIREA